jgi:hypothetical protein
MTLCCSSVAQHFSTAAIWATAAAAETNNGQFPKSSGSLDEFYEELHVTIRSLNALSQQQCLEEEGTMSLLPNDEIAKVTSTHAESLNGADSPASDHLDLALIEAVHETEFDRPEFRERIKAEIKEIGVVFLLLAALIAFAIVCWEGVGYVYDFIFSGASG